MYKLFGIPNCDTVKKARSFLEKKQVTYDFVDFKKTTPTLKDIERWSEAFGEIPVNKKGTTYKKLKDEFETLSSPKKANFVCQNSSMIKRPILEKDGKVLVFGFDEEEYKSIFS